MQSTERPFANLLEDAFANVQEIIRSEVRLAKAEAREEAVKAGRAGAVLGGGIVAAIYAIGLLLLCVVYALSLAMPPWLAALITGASLAIAAVVTIIMGRRKVRQLHVPPARVVDNLKENLEWAKHRAR